MMKQQLAKVLLICISLMTANAYAGKFTLVNHYDKALKITLSPHPEALSDLPLTFNLAVGDAIQSEVLPAPKHGYVRVEDGFKNSAYFGVEKVNDNVIIHG